MELFQHNQEIFDKYVSMRDTHKNILVIQGTGLGKTNIAIKIIDSYFRTKRVLYVIPKNILEDEVKRNKYWKYPFVDFICYHSLKKYNPKDYSLCIFDEVHRSGAPTWIKETKRFINSETCHVLGLTATAIRTDGINIGKKLFNEDDVIHGLSIFEAIDQGILPKPNYVCAELEPEETIKSIERSLEKSNQSKRNIVTEKLKVIKDSDFNELKLENIIPKHNNGSKKYIIFTPNIDDCDEWTKRFKHILHTDKVYSIHSKTHKDYNKTKMEYFNNYNGEDNIAIVGVDMLSEGLHIEGTSQIVMLRDTNSWPLYIQMMGRVLSCTNKDITPVIYDLHKNYEISECIEYNSDVNEPKSINNSLKNVSDRDGIRNHVNIVGDYTKDFNEIYNYINFNGIIWTDNMINDLYGDESSVLIAKRYNISQSAVVKKRKLLGITKNRIITWTDEMIKDIQNLNLTNRYIADKYNISTTTIANKRKSFSLESKFTHSYIDWTDEMIKDIQNLNLTNRYIADKYNISTCSVNIKRASLNISNYSKSIDWTDEMIEDLKNPNLTNKFIANKYNLGEITISKKRKSFSLESKFSHSYIDWTDEMIEDLKNPNLTNKFIANKYNISTSSVNIKRRDLNMTDYSRYIDWTDEMIEDLKNPNLTNSYIADKYDICMSTICKKRKSLGYKYTPGIKFPDYIISDIMNRSLSAKKIANKYNISCNIIMHMRAKIGIKHKHIDWTDEMIEDLKNPNLTNKFIANKYNLGEITISKKRKSLGIISNYSRKKPKTVEG